MSKMYGIPSFRPIQRAMNADSSTAWMTSGAFWRARRRAWGAR